MKNKKEKSVHKTASEVVEKILKLNKKYCHIYTVKEANSRKNLYR